MDEVYAAAITEAVGDSAVTLEMIGALAVLGTVAADEGTEVEFAALGPETQAAAHALVERGYLQVTDTAGDYVEPAARFYDE